MHDMNYSPVTNHLLSIPQTLLFDKLYKSFCLGEANTLHMHVIENFY